MLDKIKKYLSYCDDFFMPYPDIYFVKMKDAGKAYIIPVNYKGNVLPKDVLRIDAPVDGFYIYEENNSLCIIEYEILKHQLKTATDPDAIKLLKKSIKDIEIKGHFIKRTSVREHFGHIPSIKHIQNTEITKKIILSEGIRFCYSDEWYICIYIYYQNTLKDSTQQAGLLINDHLCYGRSNPKWEHVIVELLCSNVLTKGKKEKMIEIWI